MIILGIDPGYAITGFAVLYYKNSKFKVLDYGVIDTKAGIPLPNRLLSIEIGINELINKYNPDSCAVEELFFNKNIKTALKVGHGRGIPLLCAARAGIVVCEYTPLQVKQAVAGYGRASKQQVQQMVTMLLNLKEIPKPDDAADALAVAICHAHSYNYNSYV